MATGLSNDEATKLFGTLNQVVGLTANQSENLIESTAQLARQAGVAPQQVLKDIAGSSETIATFTKDSGKNLFEAAVAARQFGLNIDSVAKARSTLDFQSSLESELQASVLLGTQLNLQKARQLALDKDLVGFQAEIKNQLSDIGDFTELDVFQQESLAKALGMSVGEVAKLASGTQQLSVAGALSSESFGDLLGQDGIESNLTTLINSFKSLGATLVNELGGPLEDVIGKFKDFVQSSGGVEVIKQTVLGVASGLGKLISSLPTVIGLMVSLKAVSIAAGIAQTILAVTASAATAIIGGIGGIVIAGVIAAAIASAVGSIPKAQTGISGFDGGLLQVGESGPEIMNVPRGTSVMSAEPTRQLMNQNNNVDINPLVDATNRTTEVQYLNYR